jgi:hypothetical protein
MDVVVDDVVVVVEAAAEGGIAVGAMDPPGIGCCATE